MPDTPQTAASPAAASAGTTSPGADASGEPASQDGWPGGLPALRAELDRIDDTIHDLLMERARVVEHVARSGKAAAFRPGREASIIRRLVGRHSGALPAQTLFCMWREMLAGTTGMQAPVIVAVCETDGTHGITMAAREHFGALTPIHPHTSPARALAEVSAGTASVAVLPYPSDTAAWWSTLLHSEPRMHIIARLPFWAARPRSTSAIQAVVVASAAPDASGADRSFLGFEIEQALSRTRISSALAAVGLTPISIVLRPDHVLVEVDGHLTDDDPRLSRLEGFPRRPVVLGGYAVPIAGGAP